VPRDPLVYLDDIITACDRVLEYTRNLDRDAFLRDQLVVDAVLRNLEVIGEAAKNVSPQIRARAQDIDWKRVAGLRDVIAHQYFAVDLVTVWEIIQTKIGPLQETMKSLLKQLED
jgi:uncharacterized protein with HEPN domain